MTARQTIETATKEVLTDSSGNVCRIGLLEPATKVQLEELYRKFGPRSLPSEFLDLLELTSGFEFVPVGRMDFLGRDMSVETFFRSLPILGDGLGNFWVIDMEAGSNVLGPVIFWCHDPPVAVIQAPTLAAFLEQVFDLGRRPHENMLKFTNDRCHQIWRDDYLMPVELARKSQDEELATFASSLPKSFYLADLRHADTGAGFSWGKSNSDVRRAGPALIFGVERPGLLQELFG